MYPKIKNIIIFVGIAGLLILIYIFFIKKDPPLDNLVSSPGSVSATDPNAQTVAGGGQPPPIAQDFISLLSNVTNIKLDDTIFSDNAFNSLRDSSLILIPDGNEGRPNPFAPLGADSIEALPN